ncbi:hypothetical protein SOCEGT47_065010 [Sorangium cellulosum]|uniref:Uncharacterized protein n=2 Tax=Sorangium cellulosum TaxID=56 RepID=A0A4P2Q9P5_SORCE|nr:hypothetical protein SOCEGT47_065010 [Sorangium cellulosum]
MTGASTRARRLRLAALALVLGALHGPLLGGCAPRTSQLEQGRALRTGKPPYDELFEAARALREASLEAERRAGEARAELARALGVAPPAARDAAIEAARARAEELRASGVLLHVELVPEARIVRARRGRRLGAEDRRVVEAMEASLQRALAASRELGELAKRAAELERQRAALAAGSTEALANDPRRREVERELEAAERVLAEAGALADRHAGSASKLALDLVLALDAGAHPTRRGAASRPPPRRPAGAAKAPPRRGSGRAPTPRPDPSPKEPPSPPAPPSPPQSPGVDDFDP